MLRSTTRAARRRAGVLVWACHTARTSNLPVSPGGRSPTLPEHAWLHDQGRAEYVSADDKEALDALRQIAHLEGIVPALESAHAVAECIKRAPKMSASDIVVVNISRRGDKDIGILRENLATLTRSSS